MWDLLFFIYERNCGFFDGLRCAYHAHPTGKGRFGREGIVCLPKC